MGIMGIMGIMEEIEKLKIEQPPERWGILPPGMTIHNELENRVEVLERTVRQLIDTVCLPEFAVTYFELSKADAEKAKGE